MDRTTGCLFIGLLMVGCADGQATSGQDTATSGIVDSMINEDSGSTETDPETETDPVVTEETVPDHEVDDSWFFSREVIHTIDLSLSQASIDGLGADPYTYVTGDVAINGEALENVGVRLRGKIGSFRSLDGKPKFKIDFNQFVEDQRFWGLETLSLNNEVVDYSYLKEPLAYALFEGMGVPASRTGFAEVTVNGQPYGLYVMIEVTDDRFLKRSYEQPEGNLYDGKYVWYGGYSYTLLDFAIGVDELYQLEEGTDVAHEDIHGVSSALITNLGGPNMYAAVGEVVDWERVLREFAVEQWMGQNDGYCLNTNNNRVYFDPVTGKAEILPWDFDYSFLYDYEWGMDWNNPRGRLCYACVIDPTCKEAWRGTMEEVLATVAALDLVGMFDEMQVLIEDAAARDPRREAGWSSVVSEQAEVRAWLTRRNDEMAAEWGL